MDTSELQEVSGEDAALEQASELSTAPESDNAEAEDAFRRQVEVLAGDIAASVSPDRIKKAIAAALTQTPGEDGGRSLSGDKLAKTMERVFAQHLVTDEFGERVSQLAGEVAGELLGAHVEEALKEFESSEAFTGRVRDIAASSVGELVAEQLTGPELTSRIREIAGASLEERLGDAISEALTSVPDEAAIHETAREVVSEALAGDDLDLTIRQIANKVVAENPPPSAEEIARSAAKGVRAAVDEVLQEKLGPALSEKLSTALPEYSASEELAAVITERVEAGVAPVLETVSGAVSSEQLEKAAAELREAQSEAQQKIDYLGQRVALVSSNLEEAQGAMEEKLTAEISAALEGQVAGEELEARIRELARDISEEVAGAKLADLPDEARIRELATEAAAQAVAEGIGDRLDDLPDEEKICAAAREEAGTMVAEVLAEKLVAVPDEEQVRLLAGEVAAQLVSEVESKLGQLPGSEEIRALAEEVAGKAAAAGLEEQLAELPDSDTVRATAQEVAREVVSEVVTEKLADLPDAENIRATAQEVARKVVSETVSEQLADLPDAEKVRATAGEVAREVVAEVVSEKLAGLPDEDAIRALAGEVAGDAALPIVEEKLKSALAEQLNSEELSTRINRVAREVAAELLGARVNKLENDIENKLGREDLEGPAEELRKKTSELSAGLEALRSELGEGASKSLAEAGEQVKSMGESVAAMASFLHDTTLFNQRLNSLDLSLERMAPPEQVNDQIQTLYQDVAAAAEKFQNLPAAEVVKLAARETLEGAMKHLQAVEQEQTAKTSEQRLRALVREETGGFDRDALIGRIDEKIKEVVVEMIRSGDLQDQIKGLVRRSTERKVAPAPAGPVKVDSSEVLKELVDSDDFKIALDERFRTMLEYLKMDVMPRQVKKILKEQAEG
jgi:hypothetical protein